MPTAMPRPAATEYAPFFARYVDRVPDGDIMQQLRANTARLEATFATVPDARGGHRYAPGKWTIRETLGHLLDTERIFVYRALRIARGDATPLPGFEQNDYVVTAGSDARALSDLRAELHALRESTTRFFASLPQDSWTRSGVVSGRSLSVRALAYIVVGHSDHHLHGLAENYGVPTVSHSPA